MRSSEWRRSSHVQKAETPETASRTVALLGFAVLLGLAEMVITLPLQFYSSFALEHKYNLSNQTFRAWVWEGLKGFLVSIPVTVPLVLALFFCLKSFGSMWWLPVGSVLFILSVVLARLVPVLIFPLFYTFTPLPEGNLKSSVLRLCRSVGMSVEGVYVFDMSKNTKKANAALQVSAGQNGSSLVTRSLRTSVMMRLKPCLPTSWVITNSGICGRCCWWGR